ncbi:hypothetical protein MED121_04093 [Marinomonas sp. MED121]|nr:hypothetical protein MED121_04093 [Marinomonas sp. MED121]
MSKIIRNSIILAFLGKNNDLSQDFIDSNLGRLSNLFEASHPWDSPKASEP